MTTSQHLFAAVLAASATISICADPAKAPWLRDRGELEFSYKMYEIAAQIEADPRTAGKFSRPAPDKLEALRIGLADLRQRIDRLPKDSDGRAPADAAIYAQAVDLAIKNDEWPLPMHEPAAFECLEWGRTVADNLAADPDFIAHHLSGGIPLGFYSPVDRSVQPYTLMLPQDFDPAAKKRYRLVVFLHGSLSWGRMTTYILRSPASGWKSDPDTIQVRPFARGSNGYRWTMENDVWATIEDVKRRLPIDPDKIVLTGFSMGGGGTWFIGMTNPGAFAAIVPMAGAMATSPVLPKAADTPAVALAPLTSDGVADQVNRIGSLEALAPNNAMGVRWMMGCGGADPLLRGQQAMARVFDQAGVAYTSYVVPGVGHMSGIVMGSPEFLPFITAHTRDPNPREVFFATATLRYAERAWVRVEGLVAHYFLSSIRAKADPKKATVTVETSGITRFSLRPPEAIAPRLRAVFKIDGQDVDVSSRPAWTELAFTRTGDRWTLAAEDEHDLRKRPGLQGPINDAFARPFLCVRPTGKPQSAIVAGYVTALIDAIEKAWSATMQAALPIKNDTDVTAEDRAQFDLVLFGDPGSNRLIAETLAAREAPPLTWSAQVVRLGDQQWPAQNHLPALIFPSAFARDRYVVFNGSPLLRERLGGRGANTSVHASPSVLPGPLGDLAVMEVGSTSGNTVGATIVFGGFFDERWGLTAPGEKMTWRSVSIIANIVHLSRRFRSVGWIAAVGLVLVQGVREGSSDEFAVEPDTRGATTIHEQLARHRSQDSCVARHRKIDPAGFAQESFNPMGGCGELPDGRRFSDVCELKRALFEDPERIARNLVHQLTVFATGSAITFADGPIVADILARSKIDDYGSAR